MNSLTPVLPLFTAAALLLAGNGAQVTLLTLRAHAEGFPPSIIGAMGTAYFLGFLLGTWRATHMIASVGHIRVFATLAAAAAAFTLLLPIIQSPEFWVAARLLMGFCVAGLFTVVESWINGAANNANRGRVLSVYRLVDLTAVTGSQFALPLIGIEGFEIFSITAMLICLSLVPIAMSSRPAPKIQNLAQFNLAAVWRISPLASISIFAIGLTTSSFRVVGPLSATRLGFDVTGASFFIAIGIIGGAMLQYPLGMLSDRIDRRKVLIIATSGAAFAGIALWQLGPANPTLIYGAIFLFGMFALPLYSLSVAHANDFAESGQYALLSAGLIFIYALGATVGPTGAAMVVERFGPSALFAYIALIHLSLVAVSLVRMISRDAAPLEQRVPYTPLIRTSTAIFKLARSGLDKKHRENR